jgi:hypothetical protein
MCTVMVYTNTFFHVDRLMKELKCDSTIEPVYTKKQRNIDKKKLVAEYGSIISLSRGDEHHGIDTRKKKKIWCTICQPIIVKSNGETERDLTVIDKLVPDETDPTKMKVKYTCSRCNKTYDPTTIKKISSFLNQCKISLSMGPKQRKLDIMVFKNNIKFAGCESVEQAVEGMKLLFSKHFLPTLDSEEHRVCDIPADGRLNFTFSTVMENAGFKIGFPINRAKLNRLMNTQSPEFSDKVYMSEFDIEDVSVKVQMYSIKPTEPPGACIIYSFDKQKFEVSESEHLHYNINDGFDTFMVFSSGQCNLTGRFQSSKKQNFNFFIDQIFKNRHILEENLVPNNIAKA